MKRIFDIGCALIGLLLLAPILFLLVLLIKLNDLHSPVFFSQVRIGQYACPFRIYKFRTMKMGSSGTTVSVRGDQRISRIGAFLRHYKLDELPELWNVLKGEMSMVGPRPDVPGYADCLRGEARSILSLKPGITGAATLKYRNEEELLASHSHPEQYNDEVIYPDKVKINLDYLKNRSFWGDITIIFYTLFPK